MLFAVVLSCCLSSICVGAFCALIVELRDCKAKMRSSVCKADEIAQSFIREHNALAKRVVEIDEKTTNIQNRLNLSTLNTKGR